MWPSFYFLLFFVLASTLVVVQGQPPVIYLSPSAGTSWTGQCSPAQALACNNQNPCRVPTVSVGGQSPACEIHFKSGNYLGAKLLGPGQSGPTISFTFESNITLLEITYYNKQASFGNVSGIAQLHSVKIVILSVGGLDNSYDFRNLHFDHNSSVALSTDASSVSTFISCTFERSPLVLDPFFSLGYISSNGYNYALFLDSNITSQPGSQPFLDLVVPTTIEFYNTSFIGESIAEAYSRIGLGDTYLFRFTGPSDIRFYGPSLISFSSAKGLDYPTIDILMDLDYIGSQAMIKRSTSSTTSLQTRGASIAPIGSQFNAALWPREIQSFYSNYASLSRISLNFNTTTNISHTTFDSCACDFASHAALSDVNFTISSSESYLNIVLKSEHFFASDKIMVTVEADQQFRKPFIIDTLGIPYELPIPNSLTANALWLRNGSHLIIGNLTLTEKIGSTGSLPATISSGIDDTWTFHSIVATDIVFDLANLTTLKYWATSPELGIQVRAATTGATRPPIHPPNRILFSWPDNLAPENGIWYPLMEQLSGLPDTVQWTGAPGNTAGIAISITSAYVLQYQFNSNPIGAPIVCSPPPPPGFFCQQGTWATEGGNVTTVTLPGNSGVVQVIGNLTVQEVLVFEGTGTQLNLSGCIKVHTVEVNLEGKADPSTNLPAGSNVLVNQKGDCPDSLLDTVINVKQDEKACKKVTAVRDDAKSTSSTLAVIFSVDASKCSSGSWRWIVLGTVLGVLVLASVIAVMIYQFWKSKTG